MMRSLPVALALVVAVSTPAAARQTPGEPAPGPPSPAGAASDNVENLLNRDFNSSVVVNAPGGRYYEPGPRRTFYVGLDLMAEAAPAR